jgi:VanZ family protein
MRLATISHRFHANQGLTALPKHWLSNKRRNHQVALLLSAIFGLGIGYLTLTPNPNPKYLLNSNDKLAHLLGFACLLLPAALLYRHALYWILPCAIAFGGVIEIIQPYVNRKGEWGDFWADAIGAILGVSAGLLLRYVFRKRFAVE